MKKIFAAVLSVLIAFLFCSCSTVKPSKGVVKQTVQACAISEIADGLGIKSIEFESDISIKSVGKINGDKVIYCIELTDDGKDYSIRIANGDDETDISDFDTDNDDTVMTIYDSVSEEVAPSICVESVGNKARATASCKGYTFNILADNISSDDLQKESVKLIMQIMNFA